MAKPKEILLSLLPSVEYSGPKSNVKVFPGIFMVKDKAGHGNKSKAILRVIVKFIPGRDNIVSHINLFGYLLIFFS